MRWKIRVPQHTDFDAIADALEQSGVQVELAHERRRIISVSGFDRADPELSALLEQTGCMVHNDPQASPEQQAADDALAPLLKLHEPGVVRDLTGPWQPGDARPALEGRCGLWLLVDDGTTREITFDAGASHEQAFAWLCRNAWLEPEEIVEQRYWTETELDRERWRDASRERQAARDQAVFDRLLTGDR